MKPVVYNLSSIRAPLTGIGRYAVELVRGGMSTGKSICAVYGGKLYQQAKLPALLRQFEDLPEPAVSDWRKLSGSVPFSRDIYRQVDRWRFSRLVANSEQIVHDLNYSTSPRSGANLTTVFDLSHRLYPDTHPQHRVRFLNRYLKQLAAADTPIITISNSVRNELMECYNIPAERIHVTYLAASDDFRPRAQADCEAQLNHYGLGYKQYILSVGTLEPRKNLDGILAAYESLDPPIQAAFPLVIAGPQGWKSSEVEIQIEQMQKHGKLIKIGFVPQQDLPILYAGAAAFVYPSLYEGFGLPVVEAMQSGCPTVTSNNGALAEVSGQHALQVDPLQSSEIASALSKLLEDTTLHAHYSKSGQQRAANFSWPETVRQTHQIYNSLGE